MGYFMASIGFSTLLPHTSIDVRRPPTMATDSCTTCHRLSQFYMDCIRSIQRLQNMVAEARACADRNRESDLLVTIQSREGEGSELLFALTEHGTSRHSDHH